MPGTRVGGAAVGAILAGMKAIARHHTPVFLGLAALVALGWLAVGASASSAPVIAGLGALVLILGLPHGALDLWVASRQARWGADGRFRPGGALRFHAEYLALAGAVLAAFAFAPTLALIGFLFLSVWHFADDWRGPPMPVRLGCASIVVIVPTLFHGAEVAAIFAAVTGREALPIGPVAYPFWLVSAWIITGSVGLAAMTDRRAGAEAGALAVLAAVLPPLVFFATYFTLLHGPRHLMRHGALVAGPGARWVVAGYTLAALVLVGVAGVMLASRTDLTMSGDLLRAIFAGLAALTVPHAVLMEADKRRTVRTVTK